MSWHRHRLPRRSSLSRLKLGGGATVAVVALLFLGIFVARLSDSNPRGGETLFYAVPVGMLALRFGLRGGLVGALLGFACVVGWAQLDHEVTLQVLGYLNRGVSFLMVGTLVGVSVDQRRRREAEVLRYFQESLDLLWIAHLSGQLIRVNPAWQRALGYSAETMLSRSLMDFLHPDDREATVSALARIAGSRGSVGSRSRFKAANGSYRWLEWSARVDPSKELIHGVARDVTAQYMAEQQLTNDTRRLEMRVAERTRDLNEARAETLQLLAVAGEYRDDETSQHTERVGALAAEIAEALGLSAESVALLREAAPLHDIGKLAIPDSILLKRGRLNAQEHARMEDHAALGARLLFGSRSPALQLAGIVAESHHERWDGTGYPSGLAGEDIPLVGRIVAVADVFDALTHSRPYKSAWSSEQANAFIRHAAGTQFDPHVVATFLALPRDAAATPQQPQSQPATTGLATAGSPVGPPRATAPAANLAAGSRVSAGRRRTH
jgi:PAS domain S-box-containing protein/putative nucleotidyltransferase with HDIG domain